MTIATVFIISSLSLFFIGLYGILVKRNMIRILLALNLLETGVNLFLVAIAYRQGSDVPIITKLIEGEGFLRFVDPLPHALVLTSIVIGFGTTALALGLTVRHFKVQKSANIDTEEQGEITE